MTFEQDFDSIVLSPSHGGATGTIVALCFHDTEGGGTARNVGQFFANPATQASTTGVFGDSDSCGCVPYGTTAWHSGAGSPWNGAIEGYEHVGYASWSRAEWLNHSTMLVRSAKHFAKRCKALGIPPRKIGPDQLARAIATRNPADGGICGHYDITQAAGIYGGHTDPGPNFPWDYYIDLVRQYHDGTPAPTPTPSHPEEPLMVTDDDAQKIRQIVKEELAAAALRPWIGRDETSGGIYLVDITNTKHHIEDGSDADGNGVIDTVDVLMRYFSAVNKGDQGRALKDLPEGPAIKPQT